MIRKSMNDIGPWTVESSDSSARSIKSAERTLAVFELFALQQRPLTIGEIARMLEIPQPSVSMLMRNLTGLGYIEHDALARTYVPTIRIMLLGSWIHRRFGNQKQPEVHLTRLMRKVNETVLIAIQNGIYSQYVQVLLADQLDRMEVQSGLLRPITRTATGRSLLSLADDATVLSIARRCNAEVTETRLRVNPTTFLEMIRKIRTTGYAITAGDMTPGYGALAVAVPGIVGRISMSVSVGGPIASMERKRDLIIRSLLEFKSDFEAE